MRFSLLAGAGALLIALAGGAVFYTLLAFNHFSTVENRFAGICTPVTGVAGPEDIETAAASGRAYISSLDRRAGPHTRGAIYSVLVNDPLDSENWRDRTRGVPDKFRPSGINYYEEGGSRRLFVVNAAYNAIEIYDVEANGDLKHLETFTERRLTSPNDVIAVGLRSFYVTNDTEAGRNSWLGKLQFLTRAPAGKVYFYDGVAMRVAAEGVRYANGVAVNARGTKVYVAESAGPAIRVYERDAGTGALTLAKIEALPAAPDNITVAWDGALWIGAQPKPLATPLFEQNRTALAPSLVIRYVDKEGVAAPVTEIFSDNGEAISTSSVATVIGSRLMIGALLDDKYLICDLPT